MANNTSLVAELNRLANGGTYPARSNFKGPGGAANTWAGTSGLGIIGALNVKAGNTVANYVGLNAVCNQLAGTSGLSAVEALLQRVS